MTQTLRGTPNTYISAEENIATMFSVLSKLTKTYNHNTNKSSHRLEITVGYGRNNVVNGGGIVIVCS